MRKTLFFLLIIFTLGCGIKDPKIDPFSCPTSENFTGNGAIYDLGAGEKIANRFHVNGLTSASVNLSSVKLFMSTNNITSVTAKVFLGDNNDPDSGTLLGSGTVAITNHSASAETPVSVTFSSPIKLSVTTPNSNSYYLVIEGSPGTYDVSASTISKISRSRLDEYSGGSWRIGPEGVENISMIFNYSGCTK